MSQSIATLRANRATAGAAYVAAANAYIAAWVELAANDAIVNNRLINDGAPSTEFHGQPDVMKHADFPPAIVGSLSDLVAARLKVLIAAAA